MIELNDNTISVLIILILACLNCPLAVFIAYYSDYDYFIVPHILISIAVAVFAVLALVL